MASVISSSSGFHPSEVVSPPLRVGVDEQDALAAHREGDAQARRRRGLARPSLLVRYRQDLARAHGSHAPSDCFGIQVREEYPDERAGLPPRCAHKRAGAAQGFSAATLPRLWRRCPTAAWRTWGAPRCRLCEPLVCRRQRAGRAPCARNRFGKNARCSDCARAHEKTPVAKTGRFNWSYLIIGCFGCVCVLLLARLGS